MTHTSARTTYFSKLRNAVRMLGVIVGLLVSLYIFFAFSTTSLIAQHRSYDKELDTLIAQRSDLEYEYHTKAEQLFTLSSDTYRLQSPKQLSYISLSENVNVAFARDTQ